MTDKNNQTKNSSSTWKCINCNHKHLFMPKKCKECETPFIKNKTFIQVSS